VTISKWALATAAVGGWVAAALLWRSVYLLRKALDDLVDAIKKGTHHESN